MKLIFASTQRNSLGAIKNLILILVLMTIYSDNLFSQSNPDKTVSKDSLTWHIYIGGKPDMGTLKACEVVARNWGIKSDFFFGDCGGTYDYKEKEFEVKNKIVYEYLVQKFGENWKDKFDKEVEKEFKH